MCVSTFIWFPLSTVGFTPMFVIDAKRFPSTFTTVLYTPFGGKSFVFSGIMFAVGSPICLPSFSLLQLFQ